jgi:hypothetical protein
MPRPKLNLTVLDPGSGRAQPGAWVSVYAANTLILTTLWADDDVATLANPVQANQLGQVAMRVSPGVYDISMTWDGAQPTVVEDVLAWTPENAVVTAPGDLLVGTTTGPSALRVGQENQILLVEQGMPTWRYLASNDGAPVGPSGSLMVYGPSGVVQTILPGIQDQALAMAGGVPTWVSTLLPPGSTLPINQPGDLVVGAPGTGLPARLGVGVPDSTLMVGDNNTLVWSDPGAVGAGVGQCQLGLSGTSLRLAPYGGNKIWVNGRSRTIPDAGILLGPTGLAQDTNYYIYAAWTGSALALEASTTAYTQTGGLWHKTGDLSRSLVGYARLLDPAGWTDADTHRCVLSLFNQDERTGTNYFRAPRSLTAVGSADPPVEIHGEIRCWFIAWGFTNVTMMMTGTVYTHTDWSSANSFLALDNVPIVGTHSSAPIGGIYLNIAAVSAQTLAAQDTLHWLSIMGNVQTGGTATWSGEASGVASCRVTCTIAT